MVAWEKKQKNVSFYGVCMYVRPKLTFVSFFMFFLHFLLSRTVNGILQCGLGGQKLYNGEKKTFWVKWGLNADPFQSFCGLISRYSHQNSTRSLKSAYLRHFTFCDKSACVHYGRTGVYNPIFQEMHVQGVGGYIYIYFLKRIFCVKCGLIADQSSSLGRMRTKSAIAAFYGP